MTELLQISGALYERHPGLDPYPEETRLAEQMRRDSRIAAPDPSVAEDGDTSPR